MQTDEMSISDLADAAGLSRRAIRFYVQQKLLPPPLGRGRGNHYDRTHLDRLRRILELQSTGHSLDDIRRVLEGQAVPAPDRPAPARVRAKLSAELWTRLRLMEGVELHFDATRHQPEVDKLLAIQDLIRQAFTGEDEAEPKRPT